MKIHHYYVQLSTCPVIAIAKAKTYLFKKEQNKSKMFTTLEKARTFVRDNSQATSILYHLYTTPLHFTNVLMERNDNRNPWIFAD